MAEYWVDPSSGSNANAGTEAAPWLTIPGITGGNTVSSGDVVNVKNGTTSTLTGTSRFIPVAGVTYRGYGVASNVLYLTLPSNDPAQLTQVRVVRHPGLHEGMWIIDASAGTIDGALLTGTRSNIVVEDLHLKGPTAGAYNAVELGNNTAPGSGITIRRCYIEKAGQAGIYSFSNNVTIDRVKVEKTSEDCIILRAGSFNGYQSGSTISISSVDLSSPNYNHGTGLESGSVGDLIQLFTDTVQWDGSVEINGFRGYKSGEGKQAVVFPGGAGEFTLKNFHLDGGGNLQIMLGHMLGTVLIENFYIGEWRNGAQTNQLFRFDAKDTSPPSYGWGSGSSITIRNGVIAGRAFSGLVSMAWPFTSGPYEHDGSVEVRNITVADAFNDSTLASNVSPFTEIAGTFSFDSPQVTYGSNFTFRAYNNCIQVSGKPHIRLPSGADSKWQFDRNVFDRGSYVVGATTYGSISALQAAFSGAFGNSDNPPLLESNYRPKWRSLLRTSGARVDGLSLDGLPLGRTIGAYPAGKASASSSFVNARLELIRQRQLEELQKQMEDEEDSDDMDS